VILDIKSLNIIRYEAVCIKEFLLPMGEGWDEGGDS